MPLRLRQNLLEAADPIGHRRRGRIARGTERRIDGREHALLEQPALALRRLAPRRLLRLQPRTLLGEAG